MSKELKQMRGQLRQIAKDLLPELVTAELYAALQKEVRAQIKVIENEVKATMSEINQRNKDVNDYLVRQVTKSKE